MAQQSIPRISLSCSRGCLKTRSDLECSSQVFNKPTRRKNVKGPQCTLLTTLQLGSYSVLLVSRILARQCLLESELEHSSSNLYFKIHNNLISGMFSQVRKGKNCLLSKRSRCDCDDENMFVSEERNMVCVWKLTNLHFICRKFQCQEKDDGLWYLTPDNGFDI